MTVSYGYQPEVKHGVDVKHAPPPKQTTEEFSHKTKIGAESRKVWENAYLEYFKIPAGNIPHNFGRYMTASEFADEASAAYLRKWL